MQPNSKTLWRALAIGVAIPLINYFTLQWIYQWLGTEGLASTSGFTANFRPRTLALIAICLNLIPFTVYSRRHQYQGMRGIALPTIGFAIWWIFAFGKQIL